MDYWRDIVMNYDPPTIKGSKSKDHGTFSQKTSVILLVYLANGTDYPSSIAEYFIELSKRVYPERSCPSALKDPGKISSVLKRMNNDKLVTLSKEMSAGAGTRKYYEINPQILQSPIKDGICFKPDGSILKIPSDTIERFLRWLALEQPKTTTKMHEEQLREARHERTDEFFLDLLPSDWVDYVSFLEFIKDAASIWDSQRGPVNQQPALEDLISCYIHMTGR